MTDTTGHLAGRVAIVTGAARGIGRGIALRLARAGADVAIADLDLDGAKAWGEELTAATVPDEIRALGRRSIGVASNLAKKSEAENLIQRTVAELGRIDFLVNCAGGAMTAFEGSFAAGCTEEDMRIIIGANYDSAVFCSQAAIEQLIASAPGSAIVNFSTSHGTPVTANGSLAHYLAAKAGIVSFTRSLAGELGPKGVRVNAISPGLIKSARVSKLAGDRPVGTTEQTNLIALRRWGEVDEIAGVVEFLLGKNASYISGQCIAVNGGLTLHPN